jgi:hypothetical protein
MARQKQFLGSRETTAEAEAGCNVIVRQIGAKAAAPLEHDSLLMPRERPHLCQSTTISTTVLESGNRPLLDMKGNKNGCPFISGDRFVLWH